MSFGVAAVGDDYNVLRFGATGKGEVLDTAAIQAAIDACAEDGGGTVRFPAGAYLTGTLFLKDHVRLDLDSGACILGSPNVEDYPLMRCGFPSRTDRYTGRALLWGEGLEDIAITGRGTIDGQGALFKDNKPSGEAYEKLLGAFDDATRYRPAEAYINRPYVIRFVSCRRVLIEGIRLRNSAMWMQHYLDCDFLTIRGIDVYNHVCHNNDMMDIDCCRNVVIADCVGDTDDDALTLKSTGPRPTEHVAITNCILRSRCNAIKAGTESSGGFNDIAISNCVIQPSAADEGLYGRPEGLAGIALEIVDGGSLERVAISNVVIQGTTAPIFMRLGNRARQYKADAPAPPVGTFRDVTLNNIVATDAGATGCAIAGLPDHPIENVTLSNVRIRFLGGGTVEEIQAEVPEKEGKYPECTMFGALPAYGFYCRHVAGLTLRTIALDCDALDARPALACDDVRGLRVDGLNAQVAPDAPAVMILKATQDASITGCAAPPAPTFLKLEGPCARINTAADLTGVQSP